MSIDGGLRCGGRSSAAGPGHSPGPDRAAIAFARHQLRADATAGPSWRCRAGRPDHGSTGRAARRQIGPFRWSLVPASRCRSRNACADAGCRQYAGDSTARQPRRRPDNSAEIALFAGISRQMRVCLTGPSATSYMPRVRECGIYCREGGLWRGSSAG